MTVRLHADGWADGKRMYVAAHGRFRVRWSPRQGAQSCWTIHDQKTDQRYRAFTLDEARETIVESIRGS